MTRRAVAGGALLLALLCPPGLAAQQAPEPPEPAGAERVREWETELAEVERQLAAIEQAVLRDPELQTLNEQLGVELQAAMAEADPGLRAELERLTELDARAAEAVEKHDLVTLAQLTTAIARIEERFRRAQAAALEHPELADRVEVFHAVVRERMRRTGPEAARLLTRFGELHHLLAAVDPPPPPDTAFVPDTASAPGAEPDSAPESATR